MQLFRTSGPPELLHPDLSQPSNSQRRPLPSPASWVDNRPAARSLVHVLSRWRSQRSSGPRSESDSGWAASSNRFKVLSPDRNPPGPLVASLETDRSEHSAGDSQRDAPSAGHPTGSPRLSGTWPAGEPGSRLLAGAWKLTNSQSISRASDALKSRCSGRWSGRGASVCKAQNWSDKMGPGWSARLPDQKRPPSPRKSGLVGAQPWRAGHYR